MGSHMHICNYGFNNLSIHLGHLVPLKQTNVGGMTGPGLWLWMEIVCPG